MSWLTPTMLMESYNEASVKTNEMLKKDNIYEKREVVAEWRVPIEGEIYKIEFEHGTATGKRVLWINEKEIFRRDWMFKLVGEDFFYLNENIRCIIRVDPATGFRYSYHLFVDGKIFDQFTERQAKALKTWLVTQNEKDYRVVLEKNSLNIWVDGKLREEGGEFVDGGTDTEFIIDDNVFVLSARASGIKKHGILHTLTVNGNEITESKIDD